MTQPIAHGAFIGARISQDVRQRIGLRDPSATLAHDDHDLTLVVELLGLARSYDRLIVMDERSVRTDEDARIFRPLGTIPVLFVARRLVHADTELAWPAAGTESLHAARSCNRPARLSTLSSLFSSSGVAGTLGKRCSLVGSSPRRRIMNLLGIGLVSKNAAWLVSSSAWCSARA